MSKLLPIVILLALLSFSSASFLRPWDNQTWVSSNPHIYSYGVQYWWNIPALHTSLDSLDTGRALSMELPEETRAETVKAAEGSAKAAQKKDLCILSLVASLGALPLAPSTTFFVAFSDAFGCVSYKDSWKAAVSGSLTAAEQALSLSKLSVQEARSAYDGLVFLGMCEGEYSGPGSGRCPELRSAFISVDNNITEGRYGSYALLLGQEASLKKKLNSPAPDLSGWAGMLELAFGEGGAVETFKVVEADALSAKEEAESAYLSYLDSASIGKAEGEKRIVSLEEQKLFLMGQSLSGYEAGDIGSIQERYALLLDDKESSDGLLARAKAAKTRTREKGYLAAAVGLMSQADASYSRLMTAADRLEKDAESVVDQKREEAEKEISAAKKTFSSEPPGTGSMGLLYDAEDALAKGDSASLHGVRFSYYSQAAALARSALAGVSMTDQASASSALALLEDLISRAEKDALTVIGEKEVLRLASGLAPSQAEEAAQDAIDAIILKARSRYDSDIASSRKRIYDKLSLAGPDAADLYTDMKNLESGLITDAGPSYPQAVGSLSIILKGYQSIEEELDKHMGAIVGNAISTDAMPLLGPVSLDQPAEITLDAVLSNPRPYGAATVSAAIRTGRYGFLYSDIVYGKEGVASVRESGGGLIVVFSEIRPFETRRIVFEKQETLAHTLKSTVRANGLGAGKAIVTQEIGFELDRDIPSLELPDGCGDALIDGSSASRPLEAGTHLLSCERIMADAYEEAVANFRSYPLSATSRVEFDIRITPAIDLDTVPVMIDSPDSSAISKFKVVSVTGGHIKEQSQLSDSQYSATMAGLKKDNVAVLRVSYTIDDTPSFVQAQLAALLEANLSAEARALLEQAVLQADAANYSKALDLISQAAAQAKADGKADAKLSDKKEELLGKVRAELASLEPALSGAVLDSSFTERLSARKEELLRLIADAESQNPEQSVDTLGKLDLKWLDKELAAFKKDAYKSYNDLKERFFLAGNSTTPEAFLAFEAALQKLGASGRLEHAIEASEALSAVEKAVVMQERSKSSEQSLLASALESMKSDALAVLDHYSREASAAKGTDYSGFFTVTENRINSMVKDAEAALKKEPYLAQARIDELGQIKEKMELTLQSLDAESDAKISVLSAAIEKKEADAEAKAGLRTKLEAIRRFASGGEYVNALRAGSALSKELESEGGASNDGLLILGLTAMAMLSAAGFYMFKQQKPKELKKLPSLTDRIPGKPEAKSFTSSPLSPLSARPSLSGTPPAPVSGSSPGQPGKARARTPPDREPG